MAGSNMSVDDIVKLSMNNDYELSAEPWEFQEVRKEDIVLKTNVTTCLVCGVGDVVAHKRGDKREPVLVYGRNGTYSASHQEYICNNQNKVKPCRVSYYHGYYKLQGKTVYQFDFLKNEILITSSQTAFDLTYLIDLAATVEACSVNFEGMSKVYNRIHNRKLPSDMMDKRLELCRKRMIEAYCLYIYLELGQRYCIPNYQVIGGHLDSTILSKQEDFQTAFRNRWFSHRCNVTIDGGLKPHRMLCGSSSVVSGHLKKLE